MKVRIVRCSAENLEHEGSIGAVRIPATWEYRDESGPIVDIGWALCYAATVETVEA